MTTQDVRIKLGLGLTDFEPNAKRAERALAGVGTAGQASARQISAATRQLPAQFTDIATSLAGGQNPFLVLLQQGGQIRDSFGSIGDAARGIAGALNPVGIAIGAVAAGAATFAIAALQGRREAQELRNTLQLTGNAAGLTGSRFDELAGRIQAASRQTNDGARSIALALAASGKVTAQVIESQGTAIARIADLSGQAGDKLASAFAGQLDAPAKFAAKLNETYNFLNVAQFKRIQQLEKEGKAAEAANLTNNILLESLGKQKQELDAMAVLLPNVGLLWAGFWKSVKDAATPDSTITKIETLRKQLGKILESTGGAEPAAGTYSSGRIAVIRQQIQLLAEQARQESTAAQAAGDNAAANRKAIEQLNAPGKGSAAEFGAIRSAREQYRADFLRSERDFYTDLAKEDARIRELAAKDPLGEFINQRVLPDADNRDARRAGQQADILQDLVDANARASVQLINDERARGEAIIELDRSIALRRLRQAELTGQALADATREVDAGAALAKIGLSSQLQSSANRAGDLMSDSIATGILEGFREGSSFADIFLNELKAQFAKTILAPIIRPTVDAGNEFIAGVLRSLGSFLGVGRSPLVGATGFGDYNSTAVLSGARANGGPVAPGGAYLVGERGPEILRMGRQGGTVVPNEAIGGVGITLAPSIHIDARSDQAQVAQLVAAGMAQAQRGVFEELQKRGMVR